MKTTIGKKLGIATLFAGALTLASVGLAATAPGGAEGEQGGWRARMVEKFDTNRDGKLDDAERAKMHEEFQAKREARHQEMLQKFDANHDGKLDETERTQMRSQMAVERFKALDTNGDGNLTLDEFQAGAGKHGRGFGFGFGHHGCR